jgi:hypothetical protein
MKKIRLLPGTPPNRHAMKRKTQARKVRKREKKKVSPSEDLPTRG